MKNNFDACNKVTLAEEGGFSDHPKDPGGRTLEGVTQKTYNAYRDDKKKDRVRLSKVMRGQPDWIAERDDIYRTGYWNIVKGDDLPTGLDLMCYDIAVNSGPRRAAVILQASLIAAGHRDLTADGVVGIRTIAAARNDDNVQAVILDMAKRRQAFYKAQPTWSTFGSGWTARNVRVRDAAVSMLNVGVARHDAAVQADQVAKAPDSALPKTQASVEQTGVVTGAATGGLIAIGGLKDMLDQLTGYLTPLKDYGGPVAEWVGYALMTIAIMSALYGCWTAYASYKRRDILQGKTRAVIEPEDKPDTSEPDPDEGLTEYVPASQPA